MFYRLLITGILFLIAMYWLLALWIVWLEDDKAVRTGPKFPFKYFIPFYLLFPVKESNIVPPVEVSPEPVKKEKKKKSKSNKQQNKEVISNETTRL